MFIADSKFQAAEKARARELRQSRWWQNQLENAHCYYCARPLTRLAITMDHILPISHGGRSTKSNCVVACKPCNSLKSGMPVWEWTAYVETLKNPPPTSGTGA